MSRISVRPSLELPLNDVGIKVTIQSSAHRSSAAKRRQHIAAGVSPQGTGPYKESREAVTAMRVGHNL